MSDDLINAEIIAVIKQHRANTATMAREIVTLRADLAAWRTQYDKMLVVYTADHTRVGQLETDLQNVNKLIARLSKMIDDAESLLA